MDMENYTMSCGVIWFFFLIHLLADILGEPNILNKIF